METNERKIRISAKKILSTPSGKIFTEFEVWLEVVLVQLLSFLRAESAKRRPSA